MRFLLVLAMGLLLLGAAVTIALLSRPTLAITPAGPVNLGVVPGAKIGQSADARAAGGSGAPVSTQPTQPTARIEPIQPERIRIPRLGVDAPVVAVGVSATGSMDVPDDPKVLGWWADGAAPGAALGTAVVAGHVNTAAAGPGALSRLNELRPGEEITVVGSGRELRFKVVALRQYPKADLPAEDAFSQKVTGRLALVTSGGPFDPRSGHYRDNVIVYAVLRDGYPLES